ncbi:AMP-binding protein [Micromonospora auratinigra]|uniref:Amino acid adenylation domain-containing protein n=1 Tax=Micromonospora auratinigra TaxID=261654 RepID=A0A1A8ZIV8_9ACTN|nr:AMP-binding protein [Micromonospora auratinigra]SBT43773.1 amino acid adenylation domain-containing protein [Micromonospora auratinigra]
MTRHTDYALHGRFLQGLAAAPGRTALHLPDREVSYAELHETALRWAGALAAGPDGPPRVVGILAGKTLESYAGLLATLYVGATAVPLHPEFPAARTAGMLTACGVCTLLLDASGLAVRAELGEAGAGVPVLAPLADPDGVGDGRRIPLTGAAPLDAPRPAGPDDLAYVLFTSGSTGRPKGVPITHGNLRHYFSVLDDRYDFGPGDRFSQSFDLNFDCAMFDLFCAWGAGGSVHPVPPAAYRDLPGWVAERELTVWFSTPSAITLARRTGRLAPAAMPGLRWSFFAGEALHAADAVDWQAAAPASTLENIYGPTELTVTITGHRWSPRTSPDLCVNGLVPIGHLHDGHDGVLLTEDGTASEVEGELCITGPQLTPGYLDPADDRGRFLDRDGRRWYRTGDRVRRLENKELIYLGRLDAQVQVHGWRVELAEIEHALRGCPGVEDAVAVARAGDAGTELVVFYTGTPTAPAELSRGLRQVLPKGMLPRSYRHVPEFPLNSNRKVDRARLTREAAAG